MRALARMTCMTIACATARHFRCLGVDAASAQQTSMGCTSEQKPNAAQTLRCRGDLIIVAEDGAKFTLQSHDKSGDVDAVDLQSKAVLVDAPKQKAKRRFQVITPQAIAAVRGTKWAVDAQEIEDVGSGAERPGRGAAAERRRPGRSRSRRGCRCRPRQHRAAGRQALAAAARRCAARTSWTMISAMIARDRRRLPDTGCAGAGGALGARAGIWALQRRRPVSRPRRRRADRSASARTRRTARARSRHHRRHRR